MRENIKRRIDALEAQVKAQPRTPEELRDRYRFDGTDSPKPVEMALDFKFGETPREKFLASWGLPSNVTAWLYDACLEAAVRACDLFDEFEKTGGGPEVEELEGEGLQGKLTACMMCGAGLF